MKELEQVFINENRNRRKGRTTALVKAAKKIGAIYMCVNKSQANEIKREFEVDTVTLCQEIRGITKPIIYDHYTIAFICGKAMDKINKLKKENEKLKERWNRLKIMIMADIDMQENTGLEIILSEMNGMESEGK